MKEQYCDFEGRNYKVHSFNTIIIGSGTAGFSAADRLYHYGQEDIAMVTESIYAGTSRNTGSDKQTYYKLSLSGDDLDSVESMAQAFFDGQCVDGDNALCEAALSVQCFMNLVELGVPFPHNQYGEYVGYKTDHDPIKRATSAGPYTSKIMTECLQKAVEKDDIRIFNHTQAIRILTENQNVRGLLCLNRDTCGFEIFVCRNIVLATGAPAGMYAQSAYPLGHFGATGMAFEAGAIGKNLTEWQFGIASIHPRWNVSGTYMQVLPRFVSTNPDGSNPHEFLQEYFPSKGEMLTSIFLKGYQWPFDVRKIINGSSLIDLLVYQESQIKGRRVFLDFRKNPGEDEIDFHELSEEAFEYLSRAGACFGTPIERLSHMNGPAVEFFLGKGVNLNTEMLEIAVCAQHNNGGLSVDEWWQTNIKGLFAVGEVCGSHGVYRPGGSALNAGQVGALRAARYISLKCNQDPVTAETLLTSCRGQIKEFLDMAEKAVKSDAYNVNEAWKKAASRMSSVGAVIRNQEDIQAACQSISMELKQFTDKMGIKNKRQLGYWFRLRETLMGQLVYLGAMEDYIKHNGKSRGSSLYTDRNGVLPSPKLSGQFRFLVDNGEKKDFIQEAVYHDGKTGYMWRKVRQIPQVDNFFENVWREFRMNGG